MYNPMQEALVWYDPTIKIDLYYVVESKLEKITGITQISTDMCLQTCIAYMGPFAHLDTCPKCGTPRYIWLSKHVP